MSLHVVDLLLDCKSLEDCLVREHDARPGHLERGALAVVGQRAVRGAQAHYIYSSKVKRKRRAGAAARDWQIATVQHLEVDDLSERNAVPRYGHAKHHTG